MICVYDTHGRFRSNEWIPTNEQITKEQIQRFRSTFLFIRIRYICSPFRLEMLKKSEDNIEYIRIKTEASATKNRARIQNHSESENGRHSHKWKKKWLTQQSTSRKMNEMNEMKNKTPNPDPTSQKSFSTTPP